MIPVKVHAFGRGVNLTLGLPFIRTSPDHGTATDISWRGVASSESMEQALALAVRLLEPAEPA
jgi:4-hydroxy-L-threonine phosphate dehydrogenase PdxA